MPHATMLHQSGDDHDDILIQQFLDAPTTEDPFGLNRELEPGEKADDAEDYEDISDDDLAEDEDTDGERISQVGHEHQTAASSKSLEAFKQNADFSPLINGNGLEDNAYDDDLFGENFSSPVETNTGNGQTQTRHDQFGLSDFDESTSPRAQPVPLPMSPMSRQVEARGKIVSRPMTLDSKESPPSKELQHQQELLAMSRNGATNTDGLLEPPENCEELLASLWPKFERETIPKFMDLLPPKRARYMGRSIPKPPKPVNPTKICLELALDQEKIFKISSMPNKPNMEETGSEGIVTIEEDIAVESDNEEDLDVESDFENELVGGIFWQDLQIICEDWDTCSAGEYLGSEQCSFRGHKARSPGVYEDLDFGPNPENGWPSVKVSQLSACHGKVCSHLPTATEVRPFGGQHNALPPNLDSILPGSRASYFKDCKDHHTRPQRFETSGRSRPAQRHIQKRQWEIGLQESGTWSILKRSKPKIQHLQ